MDRFLPSTTVCSTNYSKPCGSGLEVEAYVGARIGGSVATPKTSNARAPTVSNELTPTEHRVLTVLAEGLCDKEIGRRLGVTGETIRSHLVHLYAKLGTHTRIGAVVKALRTGLLRLEDIA